MNGILLINKPKGFSSHDVVAKLRGILRTRKIGHTGTLDPDATGLLVLGVNKGTKIMQYLNNDEKIYEATICIGKATDTLDRVGEVIDSKVIEPIDNIDEVIQSFLGTYTQTPPMYSAIKYKGKRLYEYARKGIIIDDIPSRDIEVYDIKRTSEITYKDGCAYVSYTVHASKGLYVRTLSFDIGKKLGYPSYNEALNRVQAGIFRLEDSYTFEDVEQGNYEIISLSNSLQSLETLVVIDEFRKNITNGMAISLKQFKKPVLTKIIDEDGNLLAIYDKHETEPKMKALNVFL
jgi:tRNA pseudouridine55 synthase